MSAGYNLDIDLYKLHEKYAIPMGEKLSEDIFNYYENKKLGSKGGKSKRDKFIKEFVEICQRNKAEIFTAILAYYGVERQTAAENRKNDSKEKVVVADDVNEMFGKLDEISHIMSNAIFGDFKSYVQVSKYVINERFAKCKINKDGSIREIDSFHPEKTNENAINEIPKAGYLIYSGQGVLVSIRINTYAKVSITVKIRNKMMAEKIYNEQLRVDALNLKVFKFDKNKFTFSASYFNITKDIEAISSDILTLKSVLQYLVLANY